MDDLLSIVDMERFLANTITVDRATRVGGFDLLLKDQACVTRGLFLFLFFYRSVTVPLKILAIHLGWGVP